jgi:hypothetical protein
VAPLFAALALILALLGVRQARRRQHPAQAAIVSPPKSTVIASDGAVRSVQAAELTLDAAQLERLWTPENLENLARTYWRFLSRVTLGLIRVVYGDEDRRVVVIARPLTLLRFGTPEYLLEADHGKVTWPIWDGLLVARSGRGSGFLAIDVRRLDNPDPGPGSRGRVRIELEVANFYPAIAAGFSTPVYEVTQSSIHVLVTHAFLRSLSRLDLAQSRVGAMSRLRATLDRHRAEPDGQSAAPDSHPGAQDGQRAA